MRIEEVSLINVKLVVKSVDIVRLNGFFEISERLEIRNFSKSKKIVIEKFHSASWPSDIFVNNDSDSLSIDSCEVNSDNSVLFQVLWTLTVNMLINDKSVVNSDPFDSILCVFKVERLDF